MTTSGPAKGLIVGLIGFAAGYLVSESSLRSQSLAAHGVTGIHGPARAYDLAPHSTGAGPSNSNGAAFAFTQSDLVRVLKASPEDIETTRALQQRRKAGEFILRNELPLMRRSQEWRFASLTSASLSNNAAEYNRVFSELGVGPSTSQELQAHLARIYRASLEAESSLAQLMDARFQYDSRLKDLLPHAKYSLYREYEACKACESQMRAIRLLLKESACPQLERPREAGLIKLMEELDATDDVPCRGPYSPIPQVAVGREQIVALQERRIARLADGAKRLTPRLGEIGLTPEQQACVDRYYQAKLKRIRGEINSVTNYGSSFPAAANPGHDESPIQDTRTSAEPGVD